MEFHLCVVEARGHCCMSSPNPLVTFCFMTYNQEAYVREALTSVLNQDYDNLEIVISDDGSNDDTWSIVEEVVRVFREAGCRHQLVLNRNKTNLGIVAHWDLLEKMCHGELKFMAAGDDVSMTNRASRVVEAWVSDGKRATAVIHSGYEIDTKGRRLGPVRSTSLKSPMGAVMAWKRFPALEFRRVSKDGVEDVICAARARMLGSELIIPDKLLLYRVGSGLSTGLTNQREPALRGFYLWKGSFPQIYADLEVLRGSMGENRYRELSTEYHKLERQTDAYVDLIQSGTIQKRMCAFVKLAGSNRSPAALVLLLVYLLPRRLGDFLLNVYVISKFYFKRLIVK